MSTPSPITRSSMAWLQYAGLLTAFVVIVAAGHLGFRAFATTPTWVPASTCRELR